MSSLPHFEPAASGREDSTRRRRPFGVVVIVIIQIASILAVSSLEFFRLQPAIRALLAVLEEYQLSSILSQTLGGLSVVIGVVLPQFWVAWTVRALILIGLLMVVGLWSLRRWAWVLLMMQVGLAMLLDLGLYFAGQPRFISMLANVVIVFYLNQRDVQQAFVRRRAAQQPEAI